MIEFVPSDSKGDPIQTLASQIHPRKQKQQVIKIDDIADNLKSRPANFTNFCQQYYKGNKKKILLFIDQFEELFTQVDQNLREIFIKILLESVERNKDDEAPFCVLLTIRSDFYHYCIDSELSKLLNLKTDHKLSQPNTSQLMEMIEKPSDQAQINVDEVKNIIIDDMVKNNSLPLMAYILEQLHKKAKERGDNKLTIEDYKNLGGIQGVINQQAETAFKNFSKTQNLNEQDATNILKKVFFKLITINELGVVTRNKAIQEQVYDADFKAQQLVGSLTKERLLTADVDQITKNPIIEVAHEALFSSWERLKTWLKKVREDLEAARKIVETAQDWKTKGKEESYLWGGDRLKDAHDTIERLASYLSDNKEELLRTEIQRLKEKQQSVALNNFKAQTIELEPADVEEFLKPEVERLEERLQEPALDHHERQQIGLNLAYIGDTRSGVGLITDELPDIAWCKVPNGIVHLELDNQNLKFDISESFYVAKYVVTYKQFKAFVDAPDGYRNKKWRQNFSFPEFEEDKQNYRYDNYPRTNVNWSEAMAFCNWLTAKLAQDGLPEKRDDWSIRLPTEWEWQLAASGGNQKRDYPWEDQPDGKYPCNDKNSELDIVIAVGMYPYGQSPVGSFDFIGNGLEWCLNKAEWQGDVKICEIYGQQSRAIRSCSWSERSFNLKSRRKQQPQNRDSKTSFRLVYAPTSPKFSVKNLLDTEDS